MCLCRWHVISSSKEDSNNNDNQEIPRQGGFETICWWSRCCCWSSHGRSCRCRCWCCCCRRCCCCRWCCCGRIHFDLKAGAHYCFPMADSQLPQSAEYGEVRDVSQNILQIFLISDLGQFCASTCRGLTPPPIWTQLAAARIPCTWR